MATGPEGQMNKQRSRRAFGWRDDSTRTPERDPPLFHPMHASSRTDAQDTATVRACARIMPEGDEGERSASFLGGITLGANRVGPKASLLSLLETEPRTVQPLAQSLHRLHKCVSCSGLHVTASL
jgi:hypothetical protein